MINILPKHYGMYDCYQNNIIGPVSEYWSICHLPVLWAEFNFINNNENPCTFEDISIAVGSRYVRGEIWQDYCGISLEVNRYDDFNEFKTIISEELETNIPIGVTLDSNHVPWNKHFQIRPHCLLICGIDENNNEYMCCDGDFHVESICKININYLFIHYHHVLLLKQTKVEKRNYKESLKYFFNVIKKNNHQKSEDMMILINCIENCWDASDINAISSNISKSNFLLDLTEVCNSRYNFMKGIQYFNQEFQTEIFSPIILEMNDLYNKWDAFKGLYIKALLSEKKIFIEKAIKILSQIEEKEKDMTQKLFFCGEEAGV